MSEAQVTRRPKRTFMVAPPSAVAVVPSNEVKIELAEATLGLSRSAMEGLIFRGQWVEGRQYHRDPLGMIWIDRKGVQQWVLGASK